MQRNISLARKETLTVTVRARNIEHFSGKAFAVSSINNKGVFDILPEHTHFISLIQKGVTIHQSNGSTNTIPFNNAVLKVKDNIVEIYIGTLTK